jgi:hypothetical protein
MSGNVVNIRMCDIQFNKLHEKRILGTSEVGKKCFQISCFYQM